MPPKPNPNPGYVPSVYRRVTERDRELYQRHLAGFVPPNAFDAHAHLYTVPGLGVDLELSPDDASAEQTFETYRECVGLWMGDDAPQDGLFFALPMSARLDVEGENDFVAERVRGRAGSRGLVVIRPNDDPAAAESELDSGSFCGLKVYHLLADAPDTFEMDIGAFLPDWAWELADRRGLPVTLHMVRQQALSDADNQQYLRDHCLRYPNARLILAHAARGFCALHTVDGLDALRGLDNVFFDTSAIAEPSAFEAILRAFGPTRLMFGTDWPVSNIRGKCVSVADGFYWMYEHNVDWEDSQFAQPTLVGIESLLALRQAARTCALTDDDLEQIFCRTARQVLELDGPDGESNRTVGQLCDTSSAQAARVQALQLSRDGAEENPGVGQLRDSLHGATRTQALYEEAKKLIPGGTQLLSKRPEQFAPGRWPAYFKEARGCEVIDLDGRRFIDMSIMGVGSCSLGYADPDVTAAVVRRVQMGSMNTLNSPEEVELAKLLVELHPWADMVRYLRSGGEAMAAAVRIARASAGRDKVALCGYHGWHDWYLAANLPADEADDDPLHEHLLPGLDPAGVPRGLRGTVLPFRYNQLGELKAIVDEHGEELAAVVMEPTRDNDPEPGFLEGIRDLCNKCGARLVIDEITIGFRLCFPGAHLKYGVTPDLAVYAKALGNGHPMAAIVGNAETMDAAQRSFISSTYWTEGVGPTAALATLRKMQQVDFPTHAARIGRQVREGWKQLGERHGVPLHTAGHDALVKLAFDHPDGAALQTLLTIRMLDHGFLCGSTLFPCLAHEDRHVDAYLKAADYVFAELAEAVQKGDVQERIAGAVKQSGFVRLT